MTRGRCIEHGLAIGPDGGCVLCRRERGPDSRPLGDRPAGEDASPASQPWSALDQAPPSSRLGGFAPPPSRTLPTASPEPRAGLPAQDDPASSLSPAVIRSMAPGAPASKPIVVPSLYPADGDPVIVRVPPAAVAALVVALVAGTAFVWSRLGQGVSLFPQASESPAANAAASPSRPVAVTMYAGASCPDCEAARRYLNESRTAFVEWDVDTDSAARARYESLGKQRVLPTFDVGGTVVEGFSAARLDAAIHRQEPR